MAREAVDRILGEKRQAAGGDKFYSVLLGEGLQEHFLEFQFRIGLRTCFSYTDLLWFNYDPEAGCVDLEFGGYLVTIKGRGLSPSLFNGIKQKRVAWIKEADSEAQDHPGNDIFIEAITISPPAGSADNEVSEKD